MRAWTPCMCVSHSCRRWGNGNSILFSQELSSLSTLNSPRNSHAFLWIQMNYPLQSPVQPDPLVWPLRTGDWSANYQTLGKGMEKILWTPVTRPLAAKTWTNDALKCFQTCAEKLISNRLGKLLGTILGKPIDQHGCNQNNNQRHAWIQSDLHRQVSFKEVGEVIGKDSSNLSSQPSCKG